MSLLAPSLLTPYFFSPSFFLPSPLLLTSSLLTTYFSSPSFFLSSPLLLTFSLLTTYFSSPSFFLPSPLLLTTSLLPTCSLSFCASFSQLLHGIFLAFGIRTYKELIFKKFCSLDEISCHTVVISPHGRYFRDFAPAYPSIEEWKQRECIMEGQPSNKC